MDHPIRLRDYDLSIHDDNLAIPLDTVIPFDLLAGDFLPPFGNGTKANAVIKVSGFTQEKEVYAKTELHFLHGGGVLKFPKDGFVTISIQSGSKVRPSMMYSSMNGIGRTTMVPSKSLIQIRQGGSA